MTTPKPRTYVDEHGQRHVETTTEPLPIFYDWQAELPADPWHKKAGWRSVGRKLTWRDAQAFARERGIDFETQMRHDEARAELRPPVEPWGSPDSRGRP